MQICYTIPPIAIRRKVVRFINNSVKVHFHQRLFPHIASMICCSKSLFLVGVWLLLIMLHEKLFWQLLLRKKSLILIKWKASHPPLYAILNDNSLFHFSIVRKSFPVYPHYGQFRSVMKCKDNGAFCSCKMVLECTFYNNRVAHFNTSILLLLLLYYNTVVSIVYTVKTPEVHV